MTSNPALNYSGLGPSNPVVNMTNLEGKQIYKKNWKEVTQKETKAYMGDVYRSRNEFTSSFWDAETSQTRVRCTQMKYSQSLLTGNITNVTLCDCIKILNGFKKCPWCV